MALELGTNEVIYNAIPFELFSTGDSVWARQLKLVQSIRISLKPPESLTTELSCQLQHADWYPTAYLWLTVNRLRSYWSISVNLSLDDSPISIGRKQPLAFNKTLYWSRISNTCLSSSILGLKTASCRRNAWHIKLNARNAGSTQPPLRGWTSIL